MKWSWKIAQVAGIGVYVHWTFLLLVVWLFLAHLSPLQVDIATTIRLQSALEAVGFVLAVFGCVALHELGHALVAQRFGVQTRDITLLPIGGIARLERIPEDPKQELAIALAGPAVNVVIAGLLYGVIVLQNHAPLGDMETVGQVPLLWRLTAVNVVLVAFNLLPAFPMDGGRVLRALLARRMDRVHATQIASSVGQAMAILFGVWGITSGNWMLLFIALFVYLGADAETQSVQLREYFRGVRVRDAMMTDFHILSESDTLGTAVDELLSGAQHDFPVLSNGNIVGMLVRGELIGGLARFGRDARVGDVMLQDWGIANEADSLDEVFRTMNEERHSAVPVVRDGELVGLISLENIGEWVMVQSALRPGEPRRKGQ
jgi:Zn-dependent protease/CBS domain-containing protein